MGGYGCPLSEIDGFMISDPLVSMYFCMIAKVVVSSLHVLVGQLQSPFPNLRRRLK